LGNLAVEAGLADFVNENVVGLAGNATLLGSDLSEDANGQARPREGVAPDGGLVKTE